MARTLTANFVAQAARKDGASPYFIAEVQWSTGTKYYLDRPAGTFSATGTRHPATIETPLVVDWGGTTLELREGLVGGADSRSISLDDTNRVLVALLQAANQQRLPVRIWRLFDHASTVWTTDAALMFYGSMRPFSWSVDSNLVTLQLEDAAGRLLKHVSHAATLAIFSSIPPEYRDRHLPLCWGRAERVEAILVKAPWKTKTLEAIPSGTGSVVVDIDDHPNDLNIPTGTPIEVFVGDDLMTVSFTQSGTPDTVPSTMTITANSNVIARASIGHAQGTGAARYGVIFPQHIQPQYYRDILHTVAPVGTSVEVFLQRTYETPPSQGAWNATTTSTMTRNSPYPESYKIQFSNAPINRNVTVGDTVVFFDAAATRKAYPPGTLVRPKVGNYVYVANDLPSKGIIKVEGFGDILDEAGAGRKDFIIIGRMVQDELDASVEVIDSAQDPFVINLNDSTWNLGTGTAADLGHNVTTITFQQSPRHINSNLEDNRLWITLFGIEDAGNSTGALIVNPALVMVEYLDNLHLLAVDAAFINEASFTDAAAHATITNLRVGFAQIEPMSGLEILQEIARQCHSVVFFDQGEARVTVLSNSAGSSQLTFDTTTNDNIVEGTLAKQDSDVQELVSHVIGRWRKAWDDISGNKLQDVVRVRTAAEDAFERRDVELPIFIYYKRTDVEAELDFWAVRWARVYRILEFDALLSAVKLQPGDWATVSYVDAGGNALHTSQAVEVIRTEDTGIENIQRIVCRFAAFSY